MDPHERTHLFLACENGHASVVKLLLEQMNDIDVNQPADDGITPLFIACENAHIAVVNLLIKANADINKGKVDFYY